MKFPGFFHFLQDQIKRPGVLWAVLVAGNTGDAVVKPFDLFARDNSFELPPAAFLVKGQIVAPRQTVTAKIAFFFVKHFNSSFCYTLHHHINIPNSSSPTFRKRLGPRNTRLEAAPLGHVKQ